ncbi:hypothetical protein LCM20_11175 [Halobacillus litoralis]|uniref:hypothetical protein n=1 Tax=Halobacillus litoralis TaxID=45668 RepID=UPI001CD30AED|nr:hypothetical protein [Halobacillus litoralis]MCA0971155.1 hypothetical protein [Halobacillus litoralis]
MKNKWFVILVTLCLCIVTASPVQATLFEKMDPAEVENRAAVIVKGTFDFTSEHRYTEQTAPFAAVPFHISDTYKGEQEDRVTAGVDMFDLHLIEKFQKGGGEFLLFLEPSPKGFMTSVGGPNGVVYIKDGNVVQEEAERKEYYQNVMDSHNYLNGTVLLISSFGIVLAFGLVRRQRKKLNPSRKS